MENVKEIIIPIFQIIITLVVWYYIFKLLFKVIKTIFRYFVPKKENTPPIGNILQSQLSAEEEKKIMQEISADLNKSENSIWKKIFHIASTIISFPFLCILGILKGICHALTTHCPKCDSEDIDELGSKQIDRYTVYKEVTETLASGRTKTRQVPCTKIKFEDYYRCKNCGHLFTKIRTKELK